MMRRRPTSCHLQTRLLPSRWCLSSVLLVILLALEPRSFHSKRINTDARPDERPGNMLEVVLPRGEALDVAAENERDRGHHHRQQQKQKQQQTHLVRGKHTPAVPLFMQQAELNTEISHLLQQYELLHPAQHGQHQHQHQHEGKRQVQGEEARGSKEDSSATGTTRRLKSYKTKAPKSTKEPKHSREGALSKGIEISSINTTPKSWASKGTKSTGVDEAKSIKSTADNSWAGGSKTNKSSTGGDGSNDLFDLSNCNAYSNVWLRDLADTCQSSSDLTGCRCVQTEQLFSQGYLRCPMGDDFDDPRRLCPARCSVCQFCFRLQNCTGV
uniref:ShKT domain-containing protein n=1 Tax=Craspedostauros australis TaxID=1486917 RepID=A0A7R9ZNT0_9STRA|mmetsp:Transcript_4393/g.11535  ORF Transcript_4393/g.11535 Transcript_4393/m.11535 type:complete len:327 (+) Transcript_4393:360-1340(+)